MEELPLIGPHEGREFQLLEKGEKHVALFYDIIPEDYEIFKNRADYGVIEWQAEIQNQIIPYCILYRLSHKDAAMRLFDIQNSYPKGKWVAELEREIGEILGYPKKAIDAFVEQISRHKN